MRSVTLRIFVLLGIWLGLVAASHASEGCYNSVLVCKYKRNAQGLPTTAVDATCPKLPTGLQVVNTNSVARDDGWTAGTGLCGYNYSTREACGDYNLSVAVCGPGVTIFPGNPFPADPDPCDPVGPGFDPEACTGGGTRPPYLNGVRDPKALAVEQHLARVAHQLLPPHVQRAVETLGNASSVHLRATISLSSKGTGGRPLAGVYEYWEKAGKYRIHFGIDVAEIPVSEIAYNGRQYQLALDRASSTLSIKRSDERSVPSEIPNPLFLMLQPFSIETSDCPGCEPRLSDLRTLRELRHASAAEKSLAPLDTAGYGTKVALTSSGHLATSVLSKRETGLVERSEFSDYGAVEGTDLELPRTVKFSRTTNRSVVGVVIQYQVEELEIDHPIDDAVFTLDRSPYASIWSDDSQKFLRAPRCSKSPAAQ